MSDEKANGRDKSAAEIVAEALGERTQPTKLDKARDMFRRVHGREPGPGEINVPIKDRSLAFYTARWGSPEHLAEALDTMTMAERVSLLRKVLAPMLAVLLFAGCAKTTASFGVDPKDNNIVAATVDSTRFLWGTDASLSRGLDGTLGVSIGSRPDSTTTDALAIASMIVGARTMAAPAPEGEFQGRRMSSLDTLPPPEPGYQWMQVPLRKTPAAYAMPVLSQAQDSLPLGGLW
jgi:hypothetical protein